MARTPYLSRCCGHRARNVPIYFQGLGWRGHVCRACALSLAGALPSTSFRGLGWSGHACRACVLGRALCLALGPVWIASYLNSLESALFWTPLCFRSPWSAFVHRRLPPEDCSDIHIYARPPSLHQRWSKTVLWLLRHTETRDTGRGAHREDVGTARLQRYGFGCASIPVRFAPIVPNPPCAPCPETVARNG